ncbi:hypothetical protein OA92_17135 [Marinomonas sp. SBI22]|uniref:lipoprotein N-acyltransferase Lnb domain-containing protein n=1 Tax=unclassified Marinomonas TaxID=196814 RepID=UPI0007AF214A|nr:MULTISPECIES: DUF4105 domain-containing protein [unclassified Marinomonas]KZM40270.1 hypothetical protein OA92_17135 [Marinomonas sp. SBI22]KZM41687.1 hypothetical protein OA91_16370 [Marinomonas sp. SBI8L]
MMTKVHSFMAKISLIFAFVCLFLPSNSVARSIEFDAGMSEFILKNAPALISQIKRQSGVGYDSLKAQLNLRGCDEHLLSDNALIEQKTSYDFFSYLMGKINTCSTSDYSQLQKPTFTETLQGKTPYLLVAGESLNAPMSYFGHSLLLFLDEDDFYFSPVLSVLAPLESKQLFSQTLKGGFSSIKAEINLTPLHQVISFYNNYESRSLRFIKLPEDKFDSEKLIDYFDQALNDPLRYNFFVKNCATYLYEALDQACDCLDEDRSIISPALMEAQVYQQAPETQVFELKSLLAKFHKAYEPLNSFEQRTVRQMILDQGFQYQGIHQDLGDVAVLGTRLSFETYKTPYPSYSGLLDTYGDASGLLASLPETQQPNDKMRDQLYLSSFGISTNEDEHSARFALLDYRSFYQRQESINSASLAAGVLELSGIEDTSRVESVTLLEITSLKPFNGVSKNASWRFGIGAQRNQDDQLKTSLNFGLGGSMSVLGAKFYLLPSIEISSATKLPVYSGFEANMGFVSLAYENKDLLDHELSFYKRLNSSFALEYQAIKLEREETSHTASVFYYF